MAGSQFLDKTGLGVLWERIQQLVYECGCQCAVTYRLESDGNVISLIGSDGSVSTVAVTAACSCNDESE